MPRRATPKDDARLWNLKRWKTRAKNGPSTTSSKVTGTRQDDSSLQQNVSNRKYDIQKMTQRIMASTQKTCRTTKTSVSTRDQLPEQQTPLEKSSNNDPNQAEETMCSSTSNVPTEISSSSRSESILNDDLTLESGDIFSHPIERTRGTFTKSSALKSMNSVSLELIAPPRFRRNWNESECKTTSDDWGSKCDNSVQENAVRASLATAAADNVQQLQSWYACW